MFPLKIKNLICFQEVIKCGSVSEAAILLEIGQSAVSKNIIELEKSLGLKLFHRDKNHLVPTSEARLFSEKVEDLLTQMDDLVKFAGNIQSLRQGILQLSAPPSFAEGHLVDILEGFRKKHQDIHIHVDSRSSETIAKQVSTGEVDFGFAKLPVDHPKLVALPLFTSETVCIVPVSNPLSDRSLLGPAELKDEQLILLGAGTNFQHEIRRAFLRANISIKSVLETHSVAASCAYARKNMGIAIANGFIAKTYVDESVRSIPFDPKICHSYGLVSHRTFHKSLIALSFREHVIDFAKEFSMK